MRISKKKIQDLISQHKVLRGVDPFSLTKFQINQICGLVVQEVKRATKSRKEKKWISPWHFQNKKNFKPIRRFEKMIHHMLNRLSFSYPIKLKFTKNWGAEYAWFIPKENSPDFLHIPIANRFNKSKDYYNTFVHEIGHAACSKDRLYIKFNLKDEEEVAVEIIALIISFLLGINIWSESLSYIQQRSYGNPHTNKENVLYIKTSGQWKNIKNKVQRILKYLLDSNPE